MTRLIPAVLVTLLVIALCTVHHRDSVTEAATPPVTGMSVRAVEGRHPIALSSHRSSRPHRPHLNWTALAYCESRGHWHDNTGNGYYGGLQQTVEFWRSWGGLRYAARADLATRREQIRVAHNGYRVRGSEPWPTCGVLL